MDARDTRGPREPSATTRALSVALPFAVSLALFAVAPSAGPSADADSPARAALGPSAPAATSGAEPTLFFDVASGDDAVGGAVCVTDDGAGYESDAC